MSCFTSERNSTVAGLNRLESRAQECVPRNVIEDYHITAQFMGFTELSIESEYRSFRSDVARTFFVPVLSKAKFYKRAVGFFSSSSLIEVSDGITGLVKNNGRIQLVSSPHISLEDYEAIKLGYFSRDKLFTLLKKELLVHHTYYEVQRLNLLANLVRDNVLDIKVAFTRRSGNRGMYHEKMGIAIDPQGNQIAFSGSLNDSYTALHENYEAIDVFRSWENEHEASRVESKLSAFENIWKNLEPHMEVIEFPEIKDEIIGRYLKSDPNLEIDQEEFGADKTISASPQKQSAKEVKLPDGIALYDYQLAAIDSWEARDFNGIFDMATGTGKTLTALGGVVRLYEKSKGRLAVIVVCPFQHLVEQWVEDIQKFGIDPIVGYSRSSQKNWKKALANAIRDQKLGVQRKDFFCFVTTNATFRTEFVQNQIHKIKGKALLVVDEAHNFGAETLRTSLPQNIEFRLALSATIERHGDETGTTALYDYFGRRCIEYPLERAIAEGKLAPYYYYPVLVTLTDEEIEDYIEISRQISRYVIQDSSGKRSITEHGKRLLIKRARIVAGARNKLSVLRDVIGPYRDDTHILVYCGAASTPNPNEDETPLDEDELRQISQVTHMLGNDLDMRVSQFTSREDIQERNTLKQKFAEGDMLQALIAIKCLDEGMNIPKIKTAFILASTRNPKEYIQRRGRVLRLAEGKESARIYDFITVPYRVSEVESLTSDHLDWFKSLVRNELSRGREFSRMARNYFESEELFSDLERGYRITDLSFDLSGA